MITIGQAFRNGDPYLSISEVTGVVEHRWPIRFAAVSRPRTASGFRRAATILAHLSCVYQSSLLPIPGNNASAVGTRPGCLCR